MKTKLVFLLNALLLGSGIVQAAPLGTVISYQGRLDDSGSPANGTYSFRFRLLGDATGTTQIGPVVDMPSLSLAGGLLNAPLDFGSGAFNADARWLEISVKAGGPGVPGDYIKLNPQPLPPAGSSQFARVAGDVLNGTITGAKLAPLAITATHISDGAITGPKLAPGSITSGNVADETITSSKFASGQVVKSMNGLRDHVALAAGPNITLGTNGNTLTISTTGTGGGSGWSLTGNATAPGQFIGTLGSEPFEVRVNNARALRIAPGTDQPNIIGGPNIVGGANVNSVSSDLQGATISGGGLVSLFGTAYPNQILSKSLYATIGGGLGNTISTTSAESTIAGGNQNTIHSNAFRSVIGGGYRNSVGTNCDTSTISGGTQNSAGGNAAFIGGGSLNRANGSSSTMAGGYDNTVDGAVSFIGGGARNRVISIFSVASGGENNTVSGDYSNIGGGLQNLASGSGASIGGGTANGATADSATVPGGSDNFARGRHSFAAGRGARALHDGSFVWADRQGVGAIPTPFESIAPNQFNVRASGGIRLEGNVSIFGQNALKAIGYQPFVTLDDSSDPGSYGRIQIANRELVLRGHSVGSLGTYATGDRAAIRWDTSSVDLNTSTLCKINGTGGRYFWIGLLGARLVATSTGAGLSLGGVWENASDRKRKTDFEPLDKRAILRVLAGVPVERWRYTNEPAHVRHIGPTAQDFKAAFGLGTDDKSIGTVDADGVALAAIQGLNEVVAEKVIRIAELEKKLAAMEKTMARWESRFTMLKGVSDSPPSPTTGTSGAQTSLEPVRPSHPGNSDR